MAENRIEVVPDVGVARIDNLYDSVDMHRVLRKGLDLDTL